MRYRILCVDKLRDPDVAGLVRTFRTRLARYGACEEIEVASSRAAEPERAMRDEAERLIARIAPHERVWLLERSGEEFGSAELARRIAALESDGVSQLAFVVAGTFGAAPALAARADLRWSLSRLTLLHEWARALLYEQLYRAAKIARNEPYHR